MARKYPSSIFDTNNELYATLGSFWRNEFKDQGVLRAYIDGICEQVHQFENDYNELVGSLGVPYVPIFHFVRWYKLAVRESNINVGTASKLRYGPNMAVYGNQLDGSYGMPGEIFFYGGTGPPKNRYMLDLPEGMYRCLYFITNKLRKPDVLYSNGMDFVVDPTVHCISFISNPFDDNRFEIRPVFDERGNVIDREITLWFWGSEWDLNYVYKYIGFLLNMDIATSNYAKTMLVSYWAMVQRGATVPDLNMFLAGMTGVPAALGDETVEVILEYPDKRQVITNKNVYTSSAKVRVAVGDTVRFGDPLFDVFEVIELSGNNYDISNIEMLAFGKNFISGGYRGELVFENREVPVEYRGIDDDGKAVVTFEISGYDDDVKLFWDNMLKQGKLRGTTLAEMLDTRETATAQPTEADLPTTINPLKYVIENLVGSNLFLINIRNVNDFAKNAPGLKYLRFLRAVVPPHTAYIILVRSETRETECIGLDGSSALSLTEGAIVPFWASNTGEKAPGIGEVT